MRILRLRSIALLTILAIVFFGFSNLPRAKATGNSSLSFSPSTRSIVVGASTTLDAVVNPGSTPHQVSSVALYITYNQAKISLTNIACSSTFSTVLYGPVIPSPEDGTARIDCGIPGGSSAVTTSTTAATFSFTALAAATNSVVAFTTSSSIGADDDLGVNVFDGDITTGKAQVTVTSDSTTTYTVTFDKNGGDTDASPSSISEVTSGATVTLPTAPARSGYTFSGWNTVAGGSGSTFTGSTAVTSNITVYAQWTAIPTYTIGGTVSGLSGTVVLQNNGEDNLIVTSDGDFTFDTPLDNDSDYAVTVLTEPDGQACSITHDSGTVSGADVTNVTVTCTTDNGPTRSNGSPSGTLSKGTTNANLAVTTTANATCKFNTSPNITYDDSSETTFTTTGDISHSYALTGLTNGTTYNYYVRCSDSESSTVNTTDYKITFKVASKKSSSSSHHSKKKKKPAPVKRKTYTSPKKVVRGQILIQSGKRFSKNSDILLYFTRLNGTYYPPLTVHTTSSGSFSVAYRALKPSGTYHWYAFDPKTNKKSKTLSYTIR